MAALLAEPVQEPFGAITPMLGLEGESHVTDRSSWQGVVHPDDVETVSAGIEEPFA